MRVIPHTGVTYLAITEYNMIVYLMCSNLVSGVVLANASLDIAFHDTVFIEFWSIITPNFFTATNNYYKDSLSINNDTTDLLASGNATIKNNYNEYVKMFWVGLMDGDGSIQVNHWRKQSLQYRLVIKLSNIKSNYNMLIEIAKVVGGTVRITGKGQDVIWVVNKKSEVEKILEIYDTYPPLT